MTNRTVEAVVVGAGQAGVAMSEHLTTLGVSHVVLERARIAERWRTERWDSLVANGPAWHDRFPGMKIPHVSDYAFAPKDTVAQYFESYAERFQAPIHCGVEVLSVTPREGARGYFVETSEATYTTTFVIAATGPFQKPVMPALIPETESITQIHSNSYKNPQQLHPGATLVVGAGSSGVQIAEEIHTAGQEVYLSVGPHDRPPRSYRDRDFCWWLGVLGKWEAQTPPAGAEHVTIAVSGAHGGKTVNFRELGNRGIQLVGRTNSHINGTLHFGEDLVQNIRRGDENYLTLLDEADAYIEAHGLNLPEEPSARDLGPEPESMITPIRELNLKEAGITDVIWATGYTQDYSWLQADAFDENGRPAHQRGVSTAPGVYFLGLPWQSRRGSSFIWGVWHDAKFIADQIEIQRNYFNDLTAHTPERILPSIMSV